MIHIINCAKNMIRYLCITFTGSGKKTFLVLLEAYNTRQYLKMENKRTGKGRIDCLAQYQMGSPEKCAQNS